MKKLFLLLIALAFAIPSFAQKSDRNHNRDDRKKEMQEFKINYIADEIDLSGDLKEKFAEIYSQMEQERRAIFKSIKSAEKITENANATEEDFEKAAAKISQSRAEMVNLEKKYDEKFATFLSQKQLFKLHQAEMKFMDKMRSMRDNKKKSKK
ncbi:MAG: hypothetical protein J1E97_03110 [Muribaculaceae bacterium]|nr:hypothetical protein [Muribaculaceae bacterium]